MIIVNFGQNLRPSKDDYCIASNSDINIFDNIINWFNSWSGNITSVFLSNIFVGLPLGNLNSWWVTSAIGFFLTLTIFCFALTYLFHRYISLLNLPEFILLMFFTFTSLITFFWFPYNQLAIAKKNPVILIDLADSIAMWQTVTVNYFMTPLFLALLLVFIYTRRKIGLKKRDYLFSILIGLVIGFMDYVGLTTAIGVVFIVEILSYYKRRRVTELINGLTLLVSIGLAAIISFLSPGSRIRKEALAISEIAIDLNQFETIVHRTGTDIWTLLNQRSGLILMGFGLILFLVLSPKREELFRPILLGLTGIILMHIIVNNISEVFSYYANWHRLPQFILSIVFWLILGMEIGKVLKNMHVFANWKSSIVLKSSIVIFIVATQGYSISNLENSLEVRKEFWLEGKRYHAIDEINTEWIENCWKDLKLIREDKGLSVIRS